MTDIVERAKAYIHGEPAHEEYVPEVLQLLCNEIERLQSAAWRTLQLADKHAMEANDLRAQLSAPAEGQESTKSAPAARAPQNTAERIPSVMPESAGADTAYGKPGEAVYRDAIDEALVVRHLGIAKGDPRKELNDILSWEVAVALDPRVSSAAQALIDQGAVPQAAVDSKQAGEAVAHMTFEGIEKAFNTWCKTLTVVDRPSNQEIFGQGYAAGWNAKEEAPPPQAAMRKAIEAVERAARNLPRETPGCGGASTPHTFILEAWQVWDNDRALKALDKARAALSAQSAKEPK